MYISLICFLIVSFIFIISGQSFVFYFNKDKAYGIFDTFFIGLCLVGSVLNVWSLFLPTNIWSLVFLIFVSIVLFYKNYSYFLEIFKKLFLKLKTEKTFLTLILISTFIVLLYALVTPRNYDSYLYHINAIQWSEMYRTVPGLANFHNRFGFNSSMFVLSAGFSFTAIYNQYIFIINSLSVLVFFIWILKEIYFKKGVIGLFSILFLYFFIEQYALDISSPGTDLLPNVLIAFTLLSLLFNPKSFEKKHLLYVIVPLFCLTLKLSTLPILIVALFSLYLKTKKIVVSIKQLFLFCTLLLLPWLIKNVVLTGYLIYPMENLDFFNFDWEVSKESVIDIKKWTYSWARVPFKDCNEVLNMPFKKWFSIWWEAALSKNKWFFILASFAPVAYGFYHFLNRKQKNYSVLIVVAVSYLSFMLWFFTAPDIRFSFTSILILALFPLFIFGNSIEKLKKVFNPVLMISLLYCLFVIGQNGYKLFCEDYSSIKNVSKYIYLPIDVATIKERRNVKFKSHIYFTKNDNKIQLFEPFETHSQCFDKFPCTWYIDNQFKLRGDNLQDGFIKN